MIRNSNGVVVNEKGEDVFKSDVFKKLSGPDHLIKVCPSTKYLDMQIEKAYLPNPEDARNFIEFHSAKLLDDNYSLASDKATQDSYINDVVCLLGTINGIDKKAPQDIKNKILGGVFPTKKDNSEDSKIPLYLIEEIQEGKCMNFLDTQVNNLDNYDLTEKSQVAKDSTLSQEFKKVIEKLKNLDYDKSYFNSDMSENSRKYIGSCQLPSEDIDVFAKCEEDKCDLYVTQNDIINNITMFNVVKKNEQVSQNLNIPTIEKPVVQVQTNTNEITNNNVDTNSKTDEEKQLLIELDAALDKVNDIRARLHSINESKFKKTPLEMDAEKQRQINQMIEDNTLQQQPVISQNALMFK